MTKIILQMGNNDVLQSKVINFLRFPMIVAVVLQHAFLEGVKVSVPEVGIPIYHNLSFLISKVFSYVAVPLFFFISGFLFFYHTSFSLDAYKQKLRSRVRTLLIPYLFWNIVILICHWIVYLFSPIPLTSGYYKLVSDYSWLDYLRIFWDVNGAYPINGALWFVRDLMIMVVCSPLVYWTLRYCRWYILAILGGAWLFGGTFYFPLLTATFFFSLGAWFSLNGRNFVADFKSFYPWGVILYLIVALGTISTRESTGFTFVSNAGILLGLVSCVAITGHYVGKGCWRASAFLTGSCFLVYAFHHLPLNAIVRIWFKYTHPVYDWHFLLIYFMAPIVIIAIDLLAYALLKKYCPKFMAIITGGRS